MTASVARGANTTSGSTMLRPTAWSATTAATQHLCRRTLPGRFLAHCFRARSRRANVQAVRPHDPERDADRDRRRVSWVVRRERATKAFTPARNASWRAGVVWSMPSVSNCRRRHAYHGAGHCVDTPRYRLR